MQLTHDMVDVIVSKINNISETQSIHSILKPYPCCSPDLFSADEFLQEICGQERRVG